MMSQLILKKKILAQNVNFDMKNKNTDKLINELQHLKSYSISFVIIWLIRLATVILTVGKCKRAKSSLSGSMSSWEITLVPAD